ncbi:MAG: GNAT family N-acetyltransferase [Myxococcota bacterium]|nr:GNAT family N-acetyltransferase [Myxococcota bacterium]
MLETSRRADLTISMVRGLEGLRVIKPDWDRIHFAMDDPAYHQEWGWMAALQERLIEEPLYFVVLGRRDQAAAILPLHLQTLTKAGIKHSYLSFPHHNHVVLSDALIDTDLIGDEDFRDVLYFLEHQQEVHWDYIQLSGIYARSPLITWLKRSGLELEEFSANAYFDWDAGPFDTSLSKKFIKNIRRLATKAEQEQGALGTRYINDRESLPAAFEIFLELEASGWKGEVGTSTAIKHSPDLVSFYRQLLDTFCGDGAFQINLLEINGVPAAGQLCVSSGQSWFIMKVAYNDDLKRYGPGNILMLDFLEQVSTAAGFTEVNLVTSPPWADRWHLKKRPVYATQYFNGTIKGRLTEVVQHSKDVIKGFMRNGTND